MLKGCTSLTSVDLSCFVLNECNNYNQVITGITALNFLIFPSYFFPDENIIKGIFFEGLKLKYLELRDVWGATATTTDIIKNYFTQNVPLNVCQTTTILPTISRCCDYYINENNNLCYDNFIEVYYKQDCI